MALNKKIRQDDGVVTNYHRILFLMCTTNRQNSIAVVSYVDDDSRIGEKECTILQPYQRSITYETEYDPTMTIEKAYEYLKTLPEFEGAVNV
ncbi:MAG: hypothetical protein NC215_00155 [Ruminococcus sp.]|nr:hypothetical protein [Ruminococcus sp.]